MLELYQAEGCPHSTEVREKFTELGGRDQFPYLVDTDREESFYESDEIVSYLETHYS